jgi:3-oxoacyl-[acyl-carrier-protein] synthase-3
MTKLRAGIIGTGHTYPTGVLTNADLEKIVDTSDEWITTRTGIKQRHKAAPDEYTSQMGVKAAQQALERANVPAEEIDVIICATTTPDMILPSTGCIIQAEIGATKAGAFDLFAACAGFIYGLSMAEAQIRTGQAKYVLVIGAEMLTKYVDYTDRGTCILFGDGAGAVVLGAAEGDKGILSAKIKSDGSYAEMLQATGGGTRYGTTHETIDEGRHFFRMRGNEVFKVAVRSMTEIALDILQETGHSAADIDLFIPHQANQRITDAVADKLGVESSVVYSNIAQHGNTSAASIPIALDECVQAGKIKDGDLVMMTAFGGGFTWGGALVRF